jgi:lipopolysaccharide export system permease protein
MSSTPRRRLALLGTLDRYVGQTFLYSYATAMFVVTGLFVIMDMATKLDDFLEPWPDGSTVSMQVIARYYLFSTPFLFLQAAPFITFIAGLFTLSRLLRNNEVGAALAAGISGRRLLLPILAGGVLAGVGMILVREVATEAIVPTRDSLDYVLTEHSHDRVYNFVRLRDLAGSQMRLSEFRPGDEDHPPKIIDLAVHIRRGENWIANIFATTATYGQNSEGEWGLALEEGERTEISDRSNVETIRWLGADQFLFTPELAMTFRRALDNPLELSFSEAIELGRRDPDNVIYQTLMQYHLTFPLANLVLLLVGLPVLMRLERNPGAEGLAKGLLLCLFFFATDFICRNLGVQGSLDPLLASWLPVLIFGSLGVVLFESMRS